MKWYRIILLFVAACMAGISCNKQENYRPGDFYSCHHQQFWTEQTGYERLLGKWQLIYAEDGSVQQPVENVVLIFTDDGILRVFNDGAQVLTTFFHVQYWDAENIGIFTNDYSPYTEGRLLFCGNEMECSNTSNGRNNYFRKAQ